MDDHCVAILKAVMIASGQTKVELTDDDIKQAEQWSLQAPQKNGKGEGMILTIVERKKADG